MPTQNVAAKLPPPPVKTDSFRLRMRGRKHLLAASASLLSVAVAEFFVMRHAGGLEPAMVSGWRLFLGILLALFVARGNNAARILAAILSGLATLGGFVALTLLLLSGAVGRLSAGLLVCLGVIVVINGVNAYCLAFSAGISRDIRRIEHRH